MFLIYGAHECGSGREDFINENEDGFFGGELDTFADDIDKLPNSEVGGDKVFLLVDGCDVGFLNFFADDLWTEEEVREEI